MSTCTKVAGDGPAGGSAVVRDIAGLRRQSPGGLRKLLGVAVVLFLPWTPGPAAGQQTAPAQGRARPEPAPKEGPTELTKLADDLWTFRWLGWRTAFLATREGVIVFDPLNEDAAGRLAREIRRVAPNPEVRYVIYSHHHRDHARGAGRLGGRPIVVAHARTARAVAALHDPEILPPTEVFEGDEHAITLGGLRVVLALLPNGHSDDEVVATIPHRRAVIVVDSVFTDRVPPTDLGPLPGIRGQAEAVAAMDFDLLIPGHGRVGTREDATNYARFLAETERLARRAMVARRLNVARLIDDPQGAYAAFAAVPADVVEAMRPAYGRWQDFDREYPQFARSVVSQLSKGDVFPAPDAPAGKE